jgi:mono/diheme cytochrome c family protein
MAQTMNTPQGRGKLHGAGGQLPPPVYVFAIATGFVLLVLFQFLLIVRLTYGAGEARAPDWYAGGVWALLMTLVLFWVVVNLRWAAQSFRRFRAMGGYRHLAVALCCGLTATGIETVMIARILTEDPIVMDFSHSGARPSPPRATTVAITGDAAEGKKLFSMSCVTCHGPTGDGLNNLAPSLRASEFIKSSEVASILRVIQQGRALNDPANKSGKVMPARGGNPFLTDDQASHLAVFVKSLPGSGAVPSTAATDAPVVQLSRWVLPAAAAPRSGMVTLSPGRDLIDETAWQKRGSERRSLLFRNLGLSALVVHGLFLCGLFLFSSHVLFRWLLGIRGRPGHSLFNVSVWGWLVAAGSWVLLLIVFELW